MEKHNKDYKPVSPQDIQEIPLEENFDGNYIDDHGNVHNIYEDVELADKQLETIENQDKRVHFRWYESEIERCKRVAAKKGMRYTSYIKAVVTEAMNQDETLREITIKKNDRKTSKLIHYNKDGSIHSRDNSVKGQKKRRNSSNDNIK